jgi:hypothetical protein
MFLEWIKKNFRVVPSFLVRLNLFSALIDSSHQPLNAAGVDRSEILNVLPGDLLFRHRGYEPVLREHRLKPVEDRLLRDQDSSRFSGLLSNFLVNRIVQKPRDELLHSLLVIGKTI